MIRAFVLGFRGFRLDSTIGHRRPGGTTHFDEPEVNAYDLGREWAHRLTLRFFEYEPGDAYPWSRRLTLRSGK